MRRIENTGPPFGQRNFIISPLVLIRIVAEYCNDTMLWIQYRNPTFKFLPQLPNRPKKSRCKGGAEPPQ